jgi:hypothetical protein
VGVFQRVAPIFLNMEAFIFDFPAEPTSLMGERDDLLGGDFETGDPLEAGRL